MFLPKPEPYALAISAQLSELVQENILKHGGALDFAHYMDLALYAPALGYYAAGAVKFGAEGDFITAPEISPLFGQTLARQIAQVLMLTGGDVFEAGAGSGALAATVLGALAELDCLPDHYYLLEVSADLRERQAQHIAQQVPDLAHRVVWLDSWPEAMTGCVIANELLDALPVHMLHWRGEGIYQRQVIWDEQGFVWQDAPLPAGELRELAEQIAVPPDYISEIGLVGQAWVRSLADRVRHGVVLLIDYGFGEHEYYHPQRSQGTLMCHYRHFAHPDPFYFPGLQDITAHVDFTAMTVSAQQGGLKLAGFTTQAHFLANCGITDLLAHTPPDQPAKYLPQVAAVQKLMSPAEMGELFKVIAFTRGIDQPLMGFVQGDQRRRL
ncbi:MAG: SAM-dependent methyltransferase [Betaproteobacteria bacterium]|nr:SAM-dependent methyltransferase [Betaproteobacteria bacterium]